MRLLCEPEAQSPAHITVRGPYVTKPGTNKDWRSKRNINVTIDGVGTFYRPHQNTVFLQCKSNDLVPIWWKPDYKDGVPHITIYNGESRKFALRVEDILRKSSWHCNFVADQLQEYVSTDEQMGLDLLRWPDYTRIFEELFGVPITRDHLRSLSESDRLKRLHKIANLFAMCNSQSEMASLTRLRAILS